MRNKPVVNNGKIISMLIGIKFKLVLVLVLTTGGIYLRSFAQTKLADKDAKLLVPNNFKLSPYTGYTRVHWLAITERIIAGMMPYFDKTTGMPEFPKVDDGFIKFEQNFQEVNIPALRALERTMIGVIFYSKATGNDYVPGYNGSITKPFVKAIIKGTDLNNTGYWGDPQPGDQVGSVFAMAIYVNPQRFWDPLTPKQKENVLQWLKKQVYNKSTNNNFYYFHLAVTPLLDKNGVASNREYLTKMFERLMGWYQGDGWFLDGANRGIDYYNIWAFQMYDQIIYRYDPVWRKEFGKRIKNTTTAFFKTFPYLFGRDGGPIPWGRSLTYRFACNSSIGWAVLNGDCTLPPGEARRIASGSLKYFWDHGCLNKNGLLSIGYRGANTSVAEMYIEPFDPYWAMQGMSCLLIPPTDAFWKAVEQPIPADDKGGKVAVKGAQFAIRVSSIDGEARMFPAGQPFYNKAWMGQITTKYDQNAYSSYLGFCTLGEGSDELSAGRSGYSYDGKKWFYRNNVKTIQILPDHIISTYPLKPEDEKDLTPDFQLDEIVTHTLIGNDGEVHIFWHNYPHPIYLSLGGYGISTPLGNELSKQAMDKGLLISGGGDYSLLQPIKAPGGIVTGLLLKPREGWTASHIFGGQGAYINWQSIAPVPPHQPVVIYVNGTRNRVPKMGRIKVLSSPGKLNIQFEGKWYMIDVPH
jgi:hypothetical protein